MTDEVPKPQKSGLKLVIPDDVVHAVSEPVFSGPLSKVVQNAVKRFFYEAAVEANKGDVKMAALYGQMLVEGYGGPKDPALGQEWTDKARRRGYKMDGVYCKI